MKSCNCLWAEDDGTCSLGEDPPFESTCPHWSERKDPVTGEKLGPVQPAPPKKREITWRGAQPWICRFAGGYTVNCIYCYCHIDQYYSSVEEGLRRVCPNLKGKRPELVASIFDVKGS